ncbi:hypothetical protein M407DRAFT_65524 [Tulasnella calospora MUT 4182]|uniref:ribonuclease H n=1 Tax=Tulasnella calospora MUT 4182 TaxID=1051891 RepID=A0A0C3QWY9_9AGAM|nr:hypothetical protein M407DRAFT_65524 [Tulasnella calospora MUT 4182]
MRIFTGPDASALGPAFRNQDKEKETEVLDLWTDGSAINPGRADAVCASGVWSEDPTYRASFRPAGSPQSNNRGEIAAVVKALQLAPQNRVVHIRTDSTYVLRVLDKGHKRMEDEGWLNIQNSDLIRAALFLVRIRTAETYIQKVKAHSGILGNEEADRLAKEGLESEIDTSVIIIIPPNWDYSGARLQALTFNQLYRWISHLNQEGKDTAAQSIVPEVISEIHERTGIPYTEQVLWISTRSPPIRREVQDFLWQAIHGRTVCGMFFAKWGEEWIDRQYCECGNLESLQHILIGCEDRPWVGEVWNTSIELLKQAECMNGTALESPTYNQILAVGLLSAANKPATRLLKIIISETAYLIWKLRNAWVIRKETMSSERAIGALKDTIIRRAKVDLDSTKLPENRLDSKKRISKGLVTATWEVLLRNGPSSRSLRWTSSDHG